MHSSNSSSTAREGVNNIDPYVLFEALTGRKIDRPGPSSVSSASEDFVDLRDLQHNGGGELGQEPQPDKQPSNIRIGAVNPYALCEAMLGHRIDRRSQSAARIISDVLQCDYDELFDMRHNSVLFAGLKLDKENRLAEELNEKDTKILTERDLVTPDLSQLESLNDLQKLGLDNIGQTRIKMARMQNGKLRLVLNAERLAKTLSNKDLTMTVNELVTQYRRQGQGREQWTPPNSEWRDMTQELSREISHQRRLMNDFDRFNLRNDINLNQCNSARRFDDPVQGATSNSWLIAAIFSVFWADPSRINRSIRRGQNAEENRQRRLTVKLHDKGGHNNNKTQNVEVDYEVPVNNSSEDIVYCNSSDGVDIWPALYEKAFAKWITGNKGERPDITQTAHGDPIKAMAQINDKEPSYYKTEQRDPSQLVGIVRTCSVNNKTIHPMAAFTHASGGVYRGANLVANHAYSVLGWCQYGDRQYIIVRNPWGVTEPQGLTSYPGVLERVEANLWRPACLLDVGGVLAIEARAFKEYFACIGVAK